MMPARPELGARALSGEPPPTCVWRATSSATAATLSCTIATRTTSQPMLRSSRHRKPVLVSVTCARRERSAHVARGQWAGVRGRY